MSESTFYSTYSTKRIFVCLKPSNNPPQFQPPFKCSIGGCPKIMFFGQAKQKPKPPLPLPYFLVFPAHRIGIINLCQRFSNGMGISSFFSQMKRYQYDKRQLSDYNKFPRRQFSLANINPFLHKARNNHRQSRLIFQYRDMMQMAI